MFLMIILSILGFCLLTTLLLRWAFEITPLFVCSSLIVILYLGALVNLLPPVALTLLISGYLALAYSIVKLQQKKLLITTLLKPGLLLFVMATVVIWFKVRYGIFSTWDEFSQWGLFSKALFSQQHLHEALALRGSGKYPPASALFQYFVFQLLGYSEGNAYFAQDILLIVPGIALLQNRNWKQWKFILLTTLFYFFALFTFGHYSLNPVSGGAGGFLNLQVDLILATFFSIALLNTLDTHTPASMLSVIPIILCLPLFKLTGLFFAALIIMVLTTQYFFKTARHEALKYATIFMGAALFSVISWHIYIHYQTLDYGFLTQTISNPLPKDYLKMFVKTLLTQPIGSQGYLSLPLWLLIIYASFLLRTITLSKEKRLTSFLYIAWFTIGLCIYLTALWIQYVFKMDSTDLTYFASYSRYMGCYILPWIIFWYGYCSLSPNKILRALCIILTAITIISSPIVAWKFITKAGPDLLPTKLITTRFKLNWIADLLIGSTKEHAKIYVVWSKAPGFFMQILNYELLPRTINLTCWDLGEKSLYHWGCSPSPQKFIENLQSYDYLFIANENTNFTRRYATIIKKRQINKNSFSKIKLFKIIHGKKLTLKLLILNPNNPL